MKMTVGVFCAVNDDLTPPPSYARHVVDTLYSGLADIVNAVWEDERP